MGNRALSFSEPLSVCVLFQLPLKMTLGLYVDGHIRSPWGGENLSTNFPNTKCSQLSQAAMSMKHKSKSTEDV